MSYHENLKPGVIGLIQQQPNGRILQIGLTESQSNMLQFFLAKISEGNALAQMPEEHDLVLKSCVCNTCKMM